MTSASAPASASSGTGAGVSEIAPGAPIKIGSIVTQSGAINFNSSAQGTKAYIDMVNAAGGVAGHKIQLIQDDDQLNSGTGDNEFKALAAQGIFAYGAFQAPQTEGSLQSLLDGENIPLIGSYGEYAEYHDKLAFAFTTQYIHYGYEMGLYLKNLGVKVPALIFVDNDDEKANNEIINGFTAGFGGPPKYQAIKGPTDTYQNDVLQMRSDNVDGLASILDTGSYERFLQAAGSYAQTLKHVADPLFNVPAIKSLSNSDGTYVASDLEYVDSSNPKVTAYVNAVTAEFGSNADIDYIGEVGWLDGEIIVDALKSMNGVFTKAGLISAVEVPIQVVSPSRCRSPQASGTSTGASSSGSSAAGRSCRPRATPATTRRPEMKIYLVQALAGLPMGALFALQAMGIVLIYRTTKVFSFAQAALGVLAAFSTVYFRDQGVPVALAAILGVSAAVTASVLIEVTSVRFTRGAIQKTVVTLGWLLALDGLSALLFGTTVAHPAKVLDPGKEILSTTSPLLYSLSHLELGIFLVTLGSGVGLSLFLAKTSLGTAMRGVADDPEAARLLGLPVRRVAILSWAIGGTLAGLSGILAAQNRGISISRPCWCSPWRRSPSPWSAGSTRSRSPWRPASGWGC